ncbi:hypothetical protein [Brevundimonas sp.]|uniref:hypothetical protein n=1 Tax=Brevundimonas sp. TaxID=1871086 RepID=UPI00289D2CC0|nr:hypothetical protein [Brevundimonas sp.]
MSIATSVGVNAAITAALQRKRVIGHFEAGQALSADRAMPLPPKPPRHTIQALVKQGVLIETAPDHFYLDQQANRRALEGQAWAGLVVVLGLVVILAFVMAAVLIARAF